MRWFTVLSLLAVCLVCLSVAQVSFDDCCLKYMKKSRNIQRHAVRYTRQETDGDCNIPAIIFMMKRGRVYCTNPADKWVQDLMRIIDKRRSKSKYGKRPFRG
ncbi:C-C motif chemokine 25 isoform X2 [Eucyclogobius newberryi]